MPPSPERAKAPSPGHALWDMELHTTRPERAKALKLNFRMWFKNGLKAQKLLAQGIALGIMAISKAPCFTLIEQALSVFFNVNYI